MLSRHKKNRARSQGTGSPTPSTSSDRDSSPAPTTMLFVIVCEDLHGAIGPFLDLLTATQAARQATEQSDCIYRPIPFSPTMPLVKPSEKPGSTGSSSSTNDRGYL
jgi:hypothetical protein